MELVARPAHVKPGIGWFLKCGRGLSQSIVGVIVGVWALECWVMLWEVGLDEGDSVCRLDTGEEGGSECLESKEQKHHEQQNQRGGASGLVETS